MSGIIVSKYGGTSSSSLETIALKRTITQDDSRRQILILSAHGKTDYAKKDTDMLIELAQTHNPAIIDQIINKARRIYPNLPDSDFCAMHDELTRRTGQNLQGDAYMDSVKAFGEQMCSQLTSKVLGYQFVDPRELFLLSSDFGKAKILSESREMIRKTLLGKTGPFIIPGFYGYTKDRLIATLSRGGSDLTGAFVAAALDAGIYENFTDQEGILSADPRIITNPNKIREITFQEIRDLAYSGFSVFHEEAMKPVNEKNIPVHLRNTFSYPSNGAFIVKDRIADPNRPIVGVAYRNGLCSFNVDAFGLNDMVGASRKMLSVFEQRGIPIEFITTGIDDMSVILRESYLGKCENNIGGIMQDLTSVLESECNIEFQENLGSLVVAGKGLRGRKGIAAEIQSTLADSGTNIKFISQGPKERCIIYGIENADSSKAVHAIYNKYLK